MLPSVVCSWAIASEGSRVGHVARAYVIVARSISPPVGPIRGVSPWGYPVPERRTAHTVTLLVSCATVAMLAAPGLAADGDPTAAPPAPVEHRSRRRR